ncbi:hypothetical protein N9934_01145 [Desulfosarcina sp.]|nr:hypothetical protein [Desulfosarcina sp.]
MNKKGDAWEGTNFLFYVMLSIVVMGLTLTFFFYAVHSTRDDITYTKEDIDYMIQSQRFLYSEDCFVYSDQTLFRAYPTVIDESKFTQENLDNCLVSEKRFRITLKRDSYSKTLMTDNWSGSWKKVFSYNILIYDDGLYNGTIEIAYKK